jgi:hypothetical protein
VETRDLGQYDAYAETHVSGRVKFPTG